MVVGEQNNHFYIFAYCGLVVEIPISPILDEGRVLPSIFVGREKPKDQPAGLSTLRGRIAGACFKANSFWNLKHWGREAQARKGS